MMNSVLGYKRKRSIDYDDILLRQSKRPKYEDVLLETEEEVLEAMVCHKNFVLCDPVPRGRVVCEDNNEDEDTEETISDDDDDNDDDDNDNDEDDDDDDNDEDDDDDDDEDEDDDNDNDDEDEDDEEEDNKDDPKDKSKRIIRIVRIGNPNLDLDDFIKMITGAIDGHTGPKPDKEVGDEDLMDTIEEDDDPSLWEYKEIKKKVETIDDLIELGKMYDPKEKIRYNIDLKRINKIMEPLEKLKSLIGMEGVKETIIGQIVYHLQDLGKNEGDMMHTVIQGPPGVGKTLLGRILGELYFKMGILKGNKAKKESSDIIPMNFMGMPFGMPPRGRRKKKFDPFEKDDFVFRIVKRSDLIGKYLGHTAAKTQEVIDSCEGGVMFIDEAYALGNEEGRDSFSKECIDTLNQNLSENKKNFLCIIAGYKESLERCFFAYNPGLSRRFSFRYTIEGYTAEELRLIFLKKVNDVGWSIKNEEVDVPISFFEENLKEFKNFGGDMETLLFNCKIEHSMRVFCLPQEEKTKLTFEDIQNGFNKFIVNRKVEENTSYKNMYL